jgi:hypothetical protein
MVIAALTIKGRLAATLGGSSSGRTLGITGDALVADTATATATATANDRLLAIADVICSASETPEYWLDRFPGCTVAVTTVANQLLAAACAGQPLCFPLITQNGRASDPMVIALFLYGWLSAGYEMAALDPRCMDIRVRLTGSGTRVSFCMVIAVR